MYEDSLRIYLLSLNHQEVKNYSEMKGDVGLDNYF
jgi:hypothetical protein